MCGIIGIVGVKPVAARLVGSLRRLEYRGYDSAGLAVHRLAVRELPRSGTPDELLDRYGISARHIVDAVKKSA